MRRWACLVLAGLVTAVAGCGLESGRVRRETDRTIRALEARQVLHAGGGAEPGTPGETPAAPRGKAAAAKPQGAPLESPRRSFARTAWEDLKASPAALWDGTKKSFGDPVNLAGLGLAFGVDRIVRHNVDERVRDHLRDNDTSLAETDDFGTIIGNPALHFGIAGAWYAVAVDRGDPAGRAKSKVMIEALAINGMSTMLLKVSMGDKTPNGERWGWPSGHTSSSVCFASVMHEFYGLGAALPLYALAGYSAATRAEDREHDVSDLVFGAALGWVVGHSVAKGGPPEVAGFQVVPYASRDAGGVLFVKQF